MLMLLLPTYVVIGSVLVTVIVFIEVGVIDVLIPVVGVAPVAVVCIA